MSSSPVRAALSGGFAALVMAAIVAGRTTVDPDLWGHLRFGLDFLDQWRLVDIDPYSFTQDHAWINHEWLSEVLLAASYEVGGVAGMVLLKALVIGATCLVLWRLSGDVPEPYRSRILAAGVIGLGPIAVALRPQLWTALGVALTCQILVAKRPAWLVAVFAVWANLHGGWIVGAGIAGLSIVGDLIQTRSWYRAMRAGGLLAAACGATVLNPYGWRLWTFLASTVGPTREVEEWRPLWEQSNPAGFLFLWSIVAVGIVAGTLLLRRRLLPWSLWLPSLALGVMSVFVARLLPLFSITATVAALRTFAATADVVPLVRLARLMRAAVVAGIVAVQLVVASRCLPVVGWWAPDLAAASAFSDPSVIGRLVLPFNWGEYAIFHWGPRLRVSTDGRRETIYERSTVAIQNAVPVGHPAALAFLERERPEYIWLFKPDVVPATTAWLQDHGYRQDVETEMSVVARRGDVPALRATQPMSRCFP